MKIYRLVYFITVVFFCFILNGCIKNNDDGFGNSFNSRCDLPDSGIVLICKNQFIPGSISVRKGTTVTWFNKDGFIHSVVSDNSVSFNSGNIESNSNYAYRTEFTGTFNYHCSIHQETGVLTVSP